MSIRLGNEQVTGELKTGSFGGGEGEYLWNWRRETGDRGSRQVFGETGRQVKRKMGP